MSISSPFRYMRVTWATGTRDPAAPTATLDRMPGRHLDAIRNHQEFRPDWDVYRKDGWPVTITWDQVSAIWHAIFVVEQVRRAEGHESLWHIRHPLGGRDAAGNDMNGQTSPELAKSRLLGRMLADADPPPGGARRAGVGAAARR